MVAQGLGANGLGLSVRIRRVILALPLLTLTAALGGCGWMSVSGPAATDILAGERDPVSLHYAGVKVTPTNVGGLSQKSPPPSPLSATHLAPALPFPVRR